MHTELKDTIAARKEGMHFMHLSLLSASYPYYYWTMAFLCFQCIIVAQESKGFRTIAKEYRNEWRSFVTEDRNNRILSKISPFKFQKLIGNGNWWMGRLMGWKIDIIILNMIINHVYLNIKRHLRPTLKVR